MILAWQQHQPHVATEIVDEQQEVLVAARSCGRDGSAEVPEDEVEEADRASVCLLGEGAAAMLAGEAGVADLFDLLQRRQAAHHVMVSEAVQRLEGDVAISGVPAPGRLGAPGGEAHRTPDVEL